MHLKFYKHIVTLSKINYFSSHLNLTDAFKDSALICPCFQDFCICILGLSFPFSLAINVMLLKLQCLPIGCKVVSHYKSWNCNFWVHNVMRFEKLFSIEKYIGIVFLYFPGLTLE